MFRAITCNTNGIRAAHRKGFFAWLAKQNADVVCIQETKAQEHQLVDDAFRPDGYHCYYNDAERKGYSGTALYAKQEPSAIEVKVGAWVKNMELEPEKRGVLKFFSLSINH